jgi:hypothetical protein
MSDFLVFSTCSNKARLIGLTGQCGSTNVSFRVEPSKLGFHGQIPKPFIQFETPDKSKFIDIGRGDVSLRVASFDSDNFDMW